MEDDIPHERYEDAKAKFLQRKSQVDANANPQGGGQEDAKANSQGGQEDSKTNGQEWDQKNTNTKAHEGHDNANTPELEAQKEEEPPKKKQKNKRFFKNRRSQGWECWRCH